MKRATAPIDARESSPNSGPAAWVVVEFTGTAVPAGVVTVADGLVRTVVVEVAVEVAVVVAGVVPF